MTKKPPMHILVVDDHPIVRKGIVHLLSSAADGTCISEAGSIATALEQIVRKPQDVIILDLSLGRDSGLDLIRRLREENNHTPILVISVFDEVMHAEHVIRAGAQGYLMKESAPDLLIDAVHRVHQGDLVVSKQLQSRLLSMMLGRNGREPQGGLGSLTAKELEVLRLIAEGHSTFQIAGQLMRSVKTVETHRSNIQRKLSLDSSAHLLRYATLWLERGGRADQENP